MIPRVLLTTILFAAPASAQSFYGAGPARSDLDLTVRRGGLATLAPLCGMRDARWAQDLRKAAIQDATHAPEPDEPSLKGAAESDAAVSALGFADTEALEDFAAQSPKVACANLARDRGLADADLRVEKYRRDLARAQNGS
jgi:hypothetical protein